MTYLGIDLGTSGLRALLVDETGAPIGSAEAHYDVSHPHPGWSEQDPAAWIAALESIMMQLGAERLSGAVGDRGGRAYAWCNPSGCQWRCLAPLYPVERYPVAS